MNRRDFLTLSASLSATSSLLDWNRLHASVQNQLRQASAGRTFDVIVLGAGSMGSATCCFLAQRGHRVLGLEQFDIPHELGSHLGQSRIIRKAYFEHPDYVPLLDRAYRNWKVLEETTGFQVYFKTGLVYFGKPSDAVMKGIHESANKYNIEVRTLSAGETARKYPQFRLPPAYERLEEPDAGFVTPERSILLFTEQALRHRATILTKTKVLDWSRDSSGVLVRTDRGEFSSKKLVITAGPWAGKMIPGMSSKLRVTRQVLAWMKPKKWEPFVLGQFPCWMVDEYYGFPVLPVGAFGAPIGLKVARHHLGDISDPDQLNRVPNAADEKELVEAMNTFVPDAYGETHVMKVCMYTNTPDQNFILDYLPQFEKDVAIAAGFSGHGFKFSSVVGEIMADLAMNGGTSLPIGFLSAGRFR
ncbi:MAG TPA: N-methyl-L-tryptophan oxidase [Terriglobales bacterium]|nr:N-methyl-L-tryptophan oxidase [Terriglobales bacterium]